MMKKISAVLGIALAMSLPASAVLIVDFGYGEGSTSSAGVRASDSGGAGTDTTETWNFSDTTYFSDRPDAVNTNTSWYGGLSKQVTGGITLGDLTNEQERFQGNTFRTRYSYLADVVGTRSIAFQGAYIWNKADFLANSTDQLQLSVGDSMSLSIPGNNGEQRIVRMVVKQGGTYYASSTTGAGGFSITDFASETWGVLDTNDYSVGTFGSLSITNIEAVGFTFDYFAESTDNANAVAQMNFDDFQVSASVADGLSDPSYFTLDWFNDDTAGEIGTNFTVDIAIDGTGLFSVSPSSSYPTGLTFTASGFTLLPELFNQQFSLTFDTVNGQPYWMHSSVGGYRIGMNGSNTYRFDDPTEVARITADLSGLDSNLVFNLASFQSANSVSDFVIGVRDSSGTELQGGINETDVEALAPQVAGGQSDYFDFRAVSGSAGGWAGLDFAFRSANIPTNIAYEPIDLANIFGSGCVLQRDETVKIWGTATPNQVVVVEVKSQIVQTVADSNGDWLVELAPEPAGGPYTLTVTSAGTAPVVLTDVYFGDVWILTGQSNMFNQLQGLRNTAIVTKYYPTPLYRDDPGNDFDDVRFFIVKTKTTADPVDDIGIEDPWTRWQSGALGHMSVVGYYFTRALNAYFDANGMADVPIGIIKACRGATAAEEWTSAEGLATMPEPLIDAGDVLSGYYNGMIEPIQNYAIKGALWYQGENNSGSIERGEQYDLVMQALIESWRAEWGIDFPFYFVQLAPHHDFRPTPSDDERWPTLRESQTQTLAVSNTAMACIIDIGFQSNIHPPFKDIVGQRLANIALADTYGFDLVTRGPTVSDVAITNSTVTITFDNVADGLRTQAVDTQYNWEEIDLGDKPIAVSSNVLAGFALCGSDKTFYWATDAEVISTNQVRISNAVDVPNPVHVRYAWQDFPMCNLFNSAGLPAEPFRTDSYTPGSASGAEVTAPKLAGYMTATNVLVEWQPVSTAWSLETIGNLTNGSWTVIPNTNSYTSATVPLEDSGFFRLKK